MLVRAFGVVAMRRFKAILLLHCIVLLYAVTGICSKLAAPLEFFSPKWFLLYGLIIFILGIYAILWQQVLKALPLNFAYANKAVTVFWGMLFGMIFFRESIELKQVVGALMVLCGVIVMVGAGSREGRGASDDGKNADGTLRNGEEVGGDD